MQVGPGEKRVADGCACEFCTACIFLCGFVGSGVLLCANLQGSVLAVGGVLVLVWVVVGLVGGRLRRGRGFAGCCGCAGLFGLLF